MWILIKLPPPLFFLYSHPPCFSNLKLICPKTEGSLSTHLSTDSHMTHAVVLYEGDQVNAIHETDTSQYCYVQAKTALNAPLILYSHTSFYHGDGNWICNETGGRDDTAANHDAFYSFIEI